MKAYVLHGVGDLRFEDVPVPEPADNEVLVKVKAAGICGSDIQRIYKTGAYHHPLIPGHEFSGQVVKCGGGTDAWLGRRVGVFPLIPCGKCPPCIEKKFELCRGYDYLGSRRDGGFSEYCAVPASNLIALPDSVTYEEAAMLEPLSVAVHAIRRALPAPDETAAVCGLGTIGLFVVMFLREAGVENLIAVGNKSSQKLRALQLGVREENFCDITADDPASVFSGRKANVFFECVGKNSTAALAIGSTAPSGRIVLVGNPYSDMTLDKNTYWKILRDQLTVTGTWNSSFTHDSTDDWSYVLSRLTEKRIDPARLITHRYEPDGLMQGFEIMRDKTEEYIKIMAVRNS